MQIKFAAIPNIMTQFGLVQDNHCVHQICNWRIMHFALSLWIFNFTYFTLIITYDKTLKKGAIQTMFHIIYDDPLTQVPYVL